MPLSVSRIHTFSSCLRVQIICCPYSVFIHSLLLVSQGYRSWKEPSRLFESMVVVGLHPNCDAQELHRQFVDRKSDGSGKLRSSLGCENQSRVEPNIEPQVLILGSRD
jgi:hypothetical protein